MKAIIEQDLVISLGDLGDIDVPSHLLTLPVENLRYNGQELINASIISTFYICPSGLKHVVRHNAEWQRLDCTFNEILIKDDTGWRAQNEHDVYQHQLLVIDGARRNLYREVSDPLYMESYRKKENGEFEEAAIFKSQADAAVQQIQIKNPFPTPPIN
ncbi:hypothetical protein H2O73_00730 [Vibrio sp. 404]|uniref:Uncharacterized protein n=1 Tax=Vibrio marinisediminis TaxID=2758441 RepID=A0A7W2FMJ0_9VIBR|nr:hypothetical protein [Vibrio marinisediminis]MBA5760850.1 hypothetical protein [Vibrio marinisediminis]